MGICIDARRGSRGISQGGRRRRSQQIDGAPGAASHRGAVRDPTRTDRGGAARGRRSSRCDRHDPGSVGWRMVPQDGEHAGARGRATETPNSPDMRHAIPRCSAPARPRTKARSGAPGTRAAWPRCPAGQRRRAPEDHLPRADARVGQGNHRGRTRGRAERRAGAPADLHVQLPWTATLISGRCWRNGCAPARGGDRRVSYLLDFFHGAEYVQLAANAVQGKDSPGRASWPRTGGRF